MAGARGHDKDPGHFRRTQNWIGPAGSTLNNARFVPPPPEKMNLSLQDLELFIQSNAPMPLLVKVGLIHAQLETIHPFLDGNGRVGRMMITFLLYQQGVLKRPLLYLSYYFKQNRSEYYDRLQAIRDRGDWEGWLQFFLHGVGTVANEGSEVARQIVMLRERQRDSIQSANLPSYALPLYEQLFQHPFITTTRVQEITGKGFSTANRLVSQFVDLGILTETTGKSRKRVFLHQHYFNMFDEPES